MADTLGADGPPLLGEFAWNQRTHQFHSELCGAGQIVSYLDETGEVWEPEELTDEIAVAVIVVEMCDFYDRRFWTIDVSAKDGVTVMATN